MLCAAAPTVLCCQPPARRVLHTQTAPAGTSTAAHSTAAHKQGSSNGHFMTHVCQITSQRNHTQPHLLRFSTALLQQVLTHLLPASVPDAVLWSPTTQSPRGGRGTASQRSTTVISSSRRLVISSRLGSKVQAVILLLKLILIQTSHRHSKMSAGGLVQVVI
jgi:hypothetical protein